MAVQRVTPATMVTGGKVLTTQQSDNQIRQVDQRLTRLFPNDTPFLAITNQTVTGEEMKAMKYEWGEQSDQVRRVTVEGDTTADGATVAVSGTALFITPAAAVVAGDVLNDERSGEDLYVISNTSGAVVVGTRGAYQDNAVIPLTIPAGTQLTIIGSAKGEYATHSDPKGTTPTLMYNMPQIFEEVIAYSTYVKAIQYYLTFGGSEPEYQAIESMRRFKRQLENTCLWGNRLDNATGSPDSLRLCKMGWLLYWIKSVGNVHDAGGAFTYNTFLDIMSQHVRVTNGGSYAGFSSAYVGNIMRRWAGDFASEKGFYSGVSKTFGLNYDRFTGPGWDVTLFQHESFEESDVRQQQLMILKMDNNSRHYMRGLSPSTNKGIESPQQTGRHGYLDQITAAMTLKVRNPEANCMIQGITS